MNSTKINLTNKKVRQAAADVLDFLGTNDFRGVFKIDGIRFDLREVKDGDIIYYEADTNTFRVGPYDSTPSTALVGVSKTGVTLTFQLFDGSTIPIVFNEITSLQTDVADIKENIVDLQADVVGLETAIDQTNTNLNSLATTVSGLKTIFHSEDIEGRNNSLNEYYEGLVCYVTYNLTDLDASGKLYKLKPFDENWPDQYGSVDDHWELVGAGGSIEQYDESKVYRYGDIVYYFEPVNGWSGIYRVELDGLTGPIDPSDTALVFPLTVQINDANVGTGNTYSSDKIEELLSGKSNSNHTHNINWSPSTAYTVSQIRHRFGNVYECTQAHTSSTNFVSDFNESVMAGTPKWRLVSEGKKIVARTFANGSTNTVNYDLSAGNMFLEDMTGNVYQPVYVDHTNALVGHTYTFVYKLWRNKSMVYAAGKYAAPYRVLPYLTQATNYVPTTVYSPETFVFYNDNFYRRRGVTNSAGDQPDITPSKWEAMDIRDMVTAMCIAPNLLLVVETASIVTVTNLN